MFVMGYIMYTVTCRLRSAYTFVWLRKTFPLDPKTPKHLPRAQPHARRWGLLWFSRLLPCNIKAWLMALEEAALDYTGSETHINTWWGQKKTLMSLLHTHMYTHRQRGQEITQRAAIKSHTGLIMGFHRGEWRCLYITEQEDISSIFTVK